MPTVCRTGLDVSSAIAQFLRWQLRRRAWAAFVGRMNLSCRAGMPLGANPGRSIPTASCNSITRLPLVLGKIGEIGRYRCRCLASVSSPPRSRGCFCLTSDADACAAFTGDNEPTTADNHRIMLLQWVNDAPSDLFRDRLDHLRQNSLSNRPWIGHNGL